MIGTLAEGSVQGHLRISGLHPLQVRLALHKMQAWAAGAMLQQTAPAETAPRLLTARGHVKRVD